jgi:hypothetical protein
MNYFQKRFLKHQLIKGSLPKIPAVKKFELKNFRAPKFSKPKIFRLKKIQSQKIPSLNKSGPKKKSGQKSRSGPADQQHSAACPDPGRLLKGRCRSGSAKDLPAAPGGWDCLGPQARRPCHVSPGRNG